MKPYCFILMPFNQKPDGKGGMINFNEVYNLLIKPAIINADLTPIRADEEMTGGIIHKPMYERLMLCDYAIADLTTANANVFYELGVRHGIRPSSTISIFAEGNFLPFDVNFMRAIPYKLKDGIPVEFEAIQKNITDRLIAAREPTTDSPIFQLLTDYKPPDLSHLKTDTFRDAANYQIELKEKLRKARTEGADALNKVKSELGDLDDVESGVLIDLFLSYRAVKDHEAMIKLAGEMPEVLRNSTMVQEQLGFAHNRMGNHEEAEVILTNVIEKQGPSSETNGLLGRVYKDLWQKNLADGKDFAAKGFLKKAIKTYLTGFETDFRDSYPGINAVTLMELSDPPDERRKEILPVVKYAVKQKIARSKPDYWDQATLLELAVLMDDQDAASDALSEASTLIRESWEPETTANNLQLILDKRNERGIEDKWLADVIKELTS